MIDDAINNAIEKLRAEVDPKFDEIKATLHGIKNEQVAIKNELVAIRNLLERMG